MLQFLGRSTKQTFFLVLKFRISKFLWHSVASQTLPSEQVTQLAKTVHRQLLKSLHEADWFDDETRTRALNKAIKVSLQVGYPGELLNARRVTDYYSKVGHRYLFWLVND